MNKWKILRYSSLVNVLVDGREEGVAGRVFEEKNIGYGVDATLGDFDRHISPQAKHHRVGSGFDSETCSGRAHRVKF